MQNISRDSLDKLKKELKKEKASIEKELKRIVKKELKDGEEPSARFPILDGEIGGSTLEKAADETEEYSTILSIEENLENRLQSFNLALEKIRKNQYGICERCKKNVSLKRLKIYPDAKNCRKCELKN
jgi:RNA polymerase-binding transcription factor DksA